MFRNLTLELGQCMLDFSTLLHVKTESELLWGIRKLRSPQEGTAQDRDRRHDWNEIVFPEMKNPWCPRLEFFC